MTYCNRKSSTAWGAPHKRLKYLLSGVDGLFLSSTSKLHLSFRVPRTVREIRRSYKTNSFFFLSFPETWNAMHPQYAKDSSHLVIHRCDIFIISQAQDCANPPVIIDWRKRRLTGADRTITKQRAPSNRTSVTLRRIPRIHYLAATRESFRLILILIAPRIIYLGVFPQECICFGQVILENGARNRL